MEREKKEKYECYDCGCYFWVDNRNDFECPNCTLWRETRKMGKKEKKENGRKTT